MKITKKCQRCWAEEWSLTFHDSSGRGYSFDCNQEGEILPGAITKWSVGNFHRAISGFCDGSLSMEIERHEWSWIEPSEGLCDCGGTVVLDDPLWNSCYRCGQDYNMSGQRVLPPRMCEEEWDEDGAPCPYAGYGSEAFQP